MARFIKVADGIVEKVIIATAEFFNTYIDDSPGNWIQSLSGNKGDTYDSIRNACVPPKPFPSYVLNESTNGWQPPIAHPADGKSYGWNEDTTAWVEIT